MKGSGEQCGNKKCIEFDVQEGSKCLKRNWPEECKLYEPLMAKTDDGSKVPCSVGLCAGCIKANSLLLSVLNAARNRFSVTNSDHDTVLDEIETHLKELEVL